MQALIGWAFLFTLPWITRGLVWLQWWVARGLLPPVIGMWWVHLVMLAGVWLLFVRQYGLQWILGGALRRTAAP